MAQHGPRRGTSGSEDLYGHPGSFRRDLVDLKHHWQDNNLNY